MILIGELGERVAQHRRAAEDELIEIERNLE